MISLHLMISPIQMISIGEKPFDWSQLRFLCYWHYEECWTQFSCNNCIHPFKAFMLSTKVKEDATKNHFFFCTFLLRLRFLASLAPVWGSIVALGFVPVLSHIWGSTWTIRAANQQEATFRTREAKSYIGWSVASDALAVLTYMDTYWGNNWLILFRNI